MAEPLEVCPWSTGSRRKQFYRADWYRAPDCQGCMGCRPGNTHQCHVHGLVNGCDWPNSILASNYTDPYWRPEHDAGLAEGWLKS